MAIIVRQRLSGLMMPVGCGLLCFCVAGAIPWTIPPFSWSSLLLSAWFCFGGLIFTVAGVLNWRPNGVGLVLDREGIWWKCGQFRLIPWEHIAGVRVVRWMDEGIEEQGLVLGLRDSVKSSVPPRDVDWQSAELNKRFGPLPWGHLLWLEDENWEWDPIQMAAEIEAAVADRRHRDKWAWYGDSLPK